MEESAKATTSLLLMMDKDDRRVLDFEQFAKLILAIAASTGTSFDEVADDLTLALSSPGARDFDDDIIRTLTVADKEYQRARNREKSKKSREKVMDALSYSRTLRLFDLWDADNSGSIDYDELFAGLELYQKAMAKESGKYIDVEQVTAQLMAMDVDQSGALDKEEFASALVLYSQAMETDLQSLIDFMCVVTALGGA
jgi:Ca2+-binding EF-hand superfamily protein